MSKQKEITDYFFQGVLILNTQYSVLNTNY